MENQTWIRILQISLFVNYLRKKLNAIASDMHIDKYVKKLTTEKFSLLFLTSQITDQHSLAHDSQNTLLESAVQKHVGLNSICSSQLTRKQTNLPHDFFRETTSLLVDSNSGTRQKISIC